MPDEILRNGVPHNVTTSLVTRNAVLPQNTFIKDEASALRGSDLEGVIPTLVTQDLPIALDPTSSKAAADIAPNYPVSKDKLTTNDALATIKSHIRDNIQALKNLAHSDNLQRTDNDEFNKNIQSLGASRSIEDNKLFLEKKSIKTNRQLISKSKTERAAPNLAAPTATSPSDLNSDERQAHATEFQSSEKSLNDKHQPDQDTAFQMRVKKLKGHVRHVDSTLHSLDPDK